MKSILKSNYGMLVMLYCLAMAGSAFAATTVDISTIPMAVETNVAPNVLFTLDNSGSMGSSYLPDSASNNSSKRCYKNTAYNVMYYDPTKTYTPPVTSTGALMPDMPFTAALYDGFLPYSSNANPKVDLSSKFKADMDLPYGSGTSDTAQAAYYYAYSSGTPAPGTCYANSKYTLTLISGSAAQQNFANWFSYYRTRIQMMRTAMGQTFQAMPAQMRIGFNVLNDKNGNANVAGASSNPGYGFIPVAAWDATQKAKWYANLYTIEPTGYTPTPAVLAADGEYFKGNGMSGVSTVDDPVQYSCQQNFAIVATDGYWNSASLHSLPSAGDQDKKAPTSSWLTNVANLGFTPGSTWPSPFYEGSSIANSNTLADIAMKYWVTDLRPSMDNNVPVSQEDPATWQHMDTYGIALTAGTSTTQPSAWQDPTSYANLGGPVAIDDLWHAALSGHGQFMLATQGVTDLTSALQSVLTNITGRMGSAAAVAVSNANVTAGDNTSYASSYNSGTWTGDLQSYTVDTVSGNVATVTSWATSAQSQLDALTATMTASSSRHIGTFDGTSGVSFSTSGLTSAMQSRLDTPSLSDWSGVLSYIRGVNNSAYRNRSHVLGDIINAEPVPVSAPMLSYADTGYSAFKSANAGRIKVIYQGANDGMLHAFDAASGAEAWAYVPGVLFNTPLSATNPTTSSLVNLSLASGYKHMDYVDATPVEGDVDFGNTIASATTPLSTSYSPAWHSILVGGLGAGGSGYFALDVTSASGASDAAVANKVLWEFPKASNSAAYSSEIGLSYGKPILVKTAAAGWVVLLTSGYNNADGINHLFVLNPQTGAVLSDIVTASGHGLAHIAAYAQKGMTDNTATAVYGGDLDGNVWKFDFSGATVASWQASLLASLHDDNGVAQPVTTTPELASINGNPVVYVGTGQYLGNSDVPDMPGGTPNSHAAQTQSMYALADTGSPIPDVRGNTMVQQSLSTGSTTVTLAVQQPMSFSSKQGWYVDFTAQGASSGERVVTDPYLADGVLMFTTNMPSGANPCSPGGSSWLYNLDFSTGGAVTMPGSSAPAVAGQYLGTVLASRPAVVSLPGGKVVEIIRKSDATTSSYQAPISATSIGGRKVSWQEIM